LRIPRGIALFPKPGASAGTLRAEPQATWLLLFFSAYRRLMARTVVLRPSNGVAALAAFSQIMIVIVRIAFPNGRHFRQRDTLNYVSIAYIIFHDGPSQD